MSEKTNPVVRTGEIELESWSRGTRYEASEASVSGPLALTRLGCSYREVPPGKSSCPFHVHHASDEMFVILEGSGEYRFGTERHAVTAGDVLGAPAGGADSAHQLVNTGDGPLKYLGISSVAEIEICEYPDSGKIGFFGGLDAGGNRIRHITRGGAEVDYWDGEDIGAER